MGPKLPHCLVLWLSWSLTCFAKTNITVKDTDPRIAYHPPDHWRTSSTPCPRCLNPSGLGDITWHDGSLIANTPSSSEIPPVEISGRNSIIESTIASRRTQDTSTKRRRIAAREELVDMSLSLQFNGSAVYLYAIVPMGAPTPSTPTAMNLTFVMDDDVVGHYTHEPSMTTSMTPLSSFLPTNEIFSISDLRQDITHNLQVNIGPNSVLLLDRIIYTQLDEDPPNDPDRKKKIGTFAGAVAGSFGVFVVLATGLGISLVRRRRRALRREREELANRPENPTEFIPRYFPGTLPPPYTESPSVMRDSPSANQVTIPASLSSRSISRASSHSPSIHPTDESSLPDANDAAIPNVPPPPFTEAIRSPPNLSNHTHNPPSNPSPSQVQESAGATADEGSH